LLASSPDGSRINAAPQLQGACPLCLSSLIAKCGEVVRWHWAHHARDRFHSFRWSHPKRTPQRCVRPVFFDLGDDEILDVRRIYGDTRTTGWGYIRTYQEFVDAMTLTNPRGWMDMLCRGVDGMDDLVVVS